MRHLRSFAEALFSTEAGPPPAARLDWLMSEMKDYLGRASGGARFIYGLSVAVVVVLAPLLIRRLPLLIHLELPERVRALTRMEASFAAAPLMAVKAFLCVVYYEHPDVQVEVGHVGHATFPMELRR